jgi:hypothetical protein
MERLGAATRQPVTVERFLQWYGREHFDLVGGLSGIGDGRKSAQIPLPTMLLAVLVMFWVKVPSFRQLDQRLRANAGLRSLLERHTGYGLAFCDDAVRDALAQASYQSLHALLHLQGLRGIKNWGARYWSTSALALRLRPVHAQEVASKVIIAVDGHEHFCGYQTACDLCRTRTRRVKRRGAIVEVTERYHTIVVAHWVGTHPSLVLDVEFVKPGEGELTAAKRMLARMGKVYGEAIGTVLVDALYDCQPMRTLMSKLNYKLVVAHRDETRDPGRTARLALDRTDPKRERPMQSYETDEYRYECWEVDLGGGWRYVESLRYKMKVVIIQDKEGNKRVQRRRDAAATVHKAVAITDHTAEAAPAVAVAILFEARWGVENTAFHELAGEWKFDRAYVHDDKAGAARMVTLLALLAFNAMQVYVYRHLKLEPGAKHMCLLDYREDMRDTLILCGRSRRLKLRVIDGGRGP